MAAHVVEGAGVALAVTDRGEGPAVLLVHDMASDAAGVAGLAEALASVARVIAHDRRGYGGSGAPEPYDATTVNEQAEDAAAVLRAVGSPPAVVCGLGFGALVALDLLTRHSGLVRGGVLVDPPLFAFVAEAAEALSAERYALEESLREGGPQLAVERWLGDHADPDRVARARTAHRAFFADLAGLATWPVIRATLRSIDAPTAILTSVTAPPHVLAAADAVAGLIPHALREHGGDAAVAVRRVLVA